MKKAASGVPCLRRSGFAPAGRPLAVLTYSIDRSTRPSGCGLTRGKARLGVFRLAGETAGLLLTLPHLSRLNLGNSYAREKAKLLKYSKAP